MTRMNNSIREIQNLIKKSLHFSIIIPSKNYLNMNNYKKLTEQKLSPLKNCPFCIN